MSGKRTAIITTTVLSTLVVLGLTFSLKAERFDVSVVGLSQEPFNKLCKLVDLNYDGSLQDLVKKTQAGWLRKPGTERWHIEDDSSDVKQRVLPVFTELGLRDTIMPKQHYYDYSVIFGARLDGVSGRIDFLIDLWNQGIRFNQIVFLSGYRELHESELKTLKEKYGRTDIKTEPEMMEFLYHTIDHADLRRVPFVLVKAPARTLSNGSIARATTACTVNSWMELNPQPGTCMLISSQPHCVYQQVVAKTLLPKVFDLETVGKATQDTRIGVYLDTLARTFYQYAQSLK